ncbi:B3 domain-containing transcription factor LEC2 [Glycine max]|nr:B3 domain-containing transcription factor LEC2 [Glycine max]
MAKTMAKPKPQPFSHLYLPKVTSYIIILSSLVQPSIYPQNFPYNTSEKLNFPEQPYFIPLYPFPTGQVSFSNQPYGMPNSELQGSRACMTKATRERWRQVRQRSKNSTPVASNSVQEGTTREQFVPNGGSNVRITVKQHNATKFFNTPNGKKLEEILTKKLNKSDVGVLGRIVLPKREAKDKLPTLWKQEGINIVLKDVYSEIEWSIKYKYSKYKVLLHRYWTNNKSRMYILDNTGDFITLYKDELKNLYVSARKDQENLEESKSSSNTGMPHEPDAYLAYLTKELGHKGKAEAANNLLNNVEEEAPNQANQLHQFMPMNNIVGEGASNQAIEEAAPAAPINVDQENKVVDNDDDVIYGGLDNIFEIGNTYQIW